MIFLFQPLIKEYHHEHCCHDKIESFCVKVDQRSEDPAQGDVYKRQGPGCDQDTEGGRAPSERTGSDCPDQHPYAGNGRRTMGLSLIHI